MAFLISLVALIVVVVAIDFVCRSLARRRHRRLYGAAADRLDA
jgi:hypothetical protein